MVLIIRRNEDAAKSFSKLLAAQNGRSWEMTNIVSASFGVVYALGLYFFIWLSLFLSGLSVLPKLF